MGACSIILLRITTNQYTFLTSVGVEEMITGWICFVFYLRFQKCWQLLFFGDSLYAEEIVDCTIFCLKIDANFKSMNESK